MTTSDTRSDLSGGEEEQGLTVSRADSGGSDGVATEAQIPAGELAHFPRRSLSGELQIVDRHSDFVRATLPYNYAHTCNAQQWEEAARICEALEPTAGMSSVVVVTPSSGEQSSQSVAKQPAATVGLDTIYSLPQSDSDRLKEEVERLTKERDEARAMGRSLGWLYVSDDGPEWSASHPIRSGEVPDARRVRKATHGELLAFLKDLSDAHSEALSAEAKSHRRAEAAEATFSEFVGVLEPFAEAHANRPDINDAHPEYDRETIWESPSAMCLEYGHLRKAAALLQKLKAPPHDQ